MRYGLGNFNKNLLNLHLQVFEVKLLNWHSSNLIPLGYSESISIEQC